MKLLATIILACFLLPVYSQTTIPVSSTGIADIKVMMTQAAVEKLIGQPIQFKKPASENQYLDTAEVTYKGVNLIIEFSDDYISESGARTHKVHGIAASHPNLQTRSGITLGSNKFDVIKKLDGMYLSIQPDWRYDEKPDKAKYSIVRLSDGENGTELHMYFEDNILTGFYVSQFEGC